MNNGKLAPIASLFGLVKAKSKISNNSLNNNFDSNKPNTIFGYPSESVVVDNLAPRTRSSQKNSIIKREESMIKKTNEEIKIAVDYYAYLNENGLKNCEKQIKDFSTWYKAENGKKYNWQTIRGFLLRYKKIKETQETGNIASSKLYTDSHSIEFALGCLEMDNLLGDSRPSKRKKGSNIVKYTPTTKELNKSDALPLGVKKDQLYDWNRKKAKKMRLGIGKRVYKYYKLDEQKSILELYDKHLKAGSRADHFRYNGERIAKSSIHAMRKRALVNNKALENYQISQAKNTEDLMAIL